MNARDQASQTKFDRVRKMLRNRRVLVAFSGGVDSSVLALLAKRHAERAKLLTVDSITFPSPELETAQEVAEELELGIEIIEVNELDNEELVKNPPNRCYHCKKELATVWLEKAAELGFDLVVDGTNATDMEGHRPGALALEEAGVVAPFKETGITKQEIREFAKENGLSVADKPSMACLSSRFPYGTEINAKRVGMVDSVEQTVRNLFGVRSVRARFHGDIVRIEVGREERMKLFDVDKLDELNRQAQLVGFKYVTFDVYGYRTGSMDEILKEN